MSTNRDEVLSLLGDFCDAREKFIPFFETEDQRLQYALIVALLDIADAIRGIGE